MLLLPRRHSLPAERKATRSRKCNLRIRSAKKWVGRSDVSDSKDRRAARGGGSVGRTFPTHFFPRCARHGVGRSDWLRFSPRCERYRVGIERPSAQSVLRGPGERRARNRPRVRTTLIGSGLLTIAHTFHDTMWCSDSHLIDQRASHTASVYLQTVTRTRMAVTRPHVPRALSQLRCSI